MGKKIVSALVAGCLATGLVFNQPVFAEVVKTSVIPKPPTEIDGDLSKAKFPLDKAIEKAKEVFAIGSDYEGFKSGFNSYDGRAEWQLNWNRETEPSGNISVRIDAITGEIIGMDRWQDIPPGQRYSGPPKYSYEEAGKLAREWAKKLMPHYISQTRLVPNQEQPFFGYGDRGPAEYYYNFARVVNGVTFPEHNIYVRINGDAGEIMGINLNWDNKLNFPSVAGKISTAQAEKVFGENVELVYFRPPGPRQRRSSWCTG
ncbi:YcdB/YcdC domain-containing protein [Desulforamulus profundi]|uniref:YcdB/YcdC domain-containing protein n=1 Tax=Desulforamulus profundi TaxID=1383067 RepID=UPI001EE61E80|nr:YcdB/YcdC domain-containing protein [Desulforamulus profundi]